MNRIMRGAVSTVALAGAMLAMSALPASAKTITLHYFAKQTSFTMTDANGNPVSQNAMPSVGDRLSFSDDDFVGNHKHHAKRATASDHVDCNVNQPGKALCNGEQAIGGSMLLAQGFTIDFTSNGPTKVTITGGTLKYKRAHGTLVVKSLGPNGNNSDNTITFTP